MSLFKLETGQSLPAGKNEGFCITESSQGTSARKSPAQFPHFSQRQKASSQKLMIGIRGWRNLSPAGIAAWVAWVAYLPQPSERNPLRYLTAYQNFIKINAFRAIFYDDPVHKFEDPELVTYEFDEFGFELSRSDSSFVLSIIFTRSNADLSIIVYLSAPVSSGKLFPGTSNLVTVSISNESGDYDLTAVYLKHFGVLPSAGANVIAKFQAFGSDNGQFWFPTFDSQPVEVVKIPKFSFLYSISAIRDPRSIFASGWGLLHYYDWLTLLSALGGQFYAGSHLKTTDMQFWTDIGLIVDNSTGFSGRGTGLCDLGGFNYLVYSESWIAAAVSLSGTDLLAFRLSASNNNAQLFSAGNLHYSGLSVRPAKIDEGETFYTGNDGRVYPVCRFGGFVFAAISIVETKFQNGDPIPFSPDFDDWTSDYSPKYCYPEWLESNAFF